MGEAICPIACVLDEASQACRTRNKLHDQANESERCARLALEAEVGLKWDRAAAFWQSRLVLPATRPEPMVWFDYAKFCMRAGRQEAAEEALREAKTLLLDRAHPPNVKGMIDVMLASAFWIGVDTRRPWSCFVLSAILRTLLRIFSLHSRYI